jgi:spore germination cell wall hydrolase CwlJ-like protein
MTNFMWFTLCLYFEARGEGLEGMIAVGHVIMNRVEARDITVKQVVLQPNQFSWTRGDDPQGRLVKDLEALVLAAQAASRVLAERMDGKDFFGANHYFNYNAVKPKWADRMHKVARIGEHDFYKG